MRSYLYETHMHTTPSSACGRSFGREYIARYQDFGFEEVGRRKNYYDLPKEDALILTKYFETGEAEQQ